MKQEDKELLLRDLCARLPYGIKIKTSYDKMDEPIELRFINPRNESFAIGGDFTLISGLDFNKYECKPYLFPLSSMTEEQWEEYEFLCIKETSECIDIYGFSYTKDNYYDTVESIDYLYKNHIDIRGLIPKELAIDATNLNIY